MSSRNGPLWLRTSRSGNGIGLTVLSNVEVDSALVVHILPKLWRPTRQRQAVLTPENGGTIYLYEGDYLGFTGQWRDLANRRLAPAEWSPRRTEGVALGESGSGDPLWSRDSPPSDAVNSLSQETDGSVSTMWELLLGCGQQPAIVPGAVQPSPTGTRLLAATPDLEHLVKATFVGAAYSAIPRRRPVYQSVTERSGVVRGRLIPRDLVTRALRREARVTCEFDELSVDHQLWRIVRSALETCLTTPGQTEPVLSSLAQLHDVGTPPAIQALRDAQNLAPTIRSPDLRNLLDLAVDVLSGNYGLAPETNRGQGVVANVKFTTSDLWESLLERSFKHTGCSVSPQESLDVVYHSEPTGWKSGAPKHPDLTVVTPSGIRFIVDAKYKDARSFDSASQSDQYQVIAYAQRTGHPALLAFARSRQHPAGKNSGEVTLRALPPTGWSDVGRTSPHPDSTWNFVGSTVFDFPDPGSFLSLPQCIETMSKSATRIVDQVERIHFAG